MGDYGFEGAGEHADTDFPHIVIEALEAYMCEENDFEDNHSSLDCWMAEYPDLESAEKELVVLQNKSNSLALLRFSSKEEYYAECHAIEHDTMMLERVLDRHYKDFIPEGMKHEDFSIGTTFRTGGGKWMCTDVGSRTIICIRYNPYDPSWMKGPPYPVDEKVFNEYDFGGCTFVSK